ncbi:hypothetical protein Gbth_009_032 [Gluconobacter thailandicus F149-1 = NBRC 100600]|uniref:Glycosyltransferase 2-like domain-containing protein n=1 Tax=Gluconobacter thailandicus NBRC 3257 TaxID=1381097 RepID=A0ABQ0ITX7_GLUTH|nr:glycosyltransferase family 2 protein [Gluconobacter thailandicus]KXV54220.1 hypothetical protein AD946_04040 [Gluconobacter thailandicus]GAC88951.1 hypothetical protein NBRC3255_2612 [Gluconobacter thailandicus NBRC 3255]GAD25655.1 hypothetical protein NBRC3257_0654 [Gluconobacter thailandicus NBRC 3257]GAN92434.1 hypothetical protein Gbth_009_032 [Gluconobacter thailandicus F149-1 = NBRC 100600]GBR61248.1 hypothetical protein AA100600_2606 [Gluconobacter thailandicus F149-1 = NBRC 100600]
MANAICAVLTRNAAPLLGEWLAWHLSLGFERILVVDAGSTDGTQAIARAAGKVGPVELLDCVLPDTLSSTERREALTAEAIRLARQDQDWLLILDADEFLDPSSTLDDLLNTGRTADGIAINWCVYGQPVQSVTGSCLISRFHYRSTPAFSDNGFVRILARTSALETVSDAVFSGLPMDNLVHADGQDFTHFSTPARWNGARILHYVWAGDPHMPSHLAAHYLCQDQEDRSPERRLDGMLPIRDALTGAVTQQGLETLLAGLGESLRTMLAPTPESVATIPDEGHHASFSFHRVRPSERERLLLTPQAAPLPSRTRTCFLQDMSGRFLTLTESGTLTTRSDEEGLEPDKKLIAVYQDSHPDILTLLSLDGRPVRYATGALQQPVLRIQMASDDTVHFFVNDAVGDQAFKKIPAKLALSPAPLSLPASDTPEGLSLPGFCTWLFFHPNRSLLDVARVATTLSEEGRAALGQAAPEIGTLL